MGLRDIGNNRQAGSRSVSSPVGTQAGLDSIHSPLLGPSAHRLWSFMYLRFFIEIDLHVISVEAIRAVTVAQCQISIGFLHVFVFCHHHLDEQIHRDSPSILLS